MVFSEWEKKIPPYYNTMYLDDYSPEQIMFAVRREMREQVQEKRQEKEAVKTINIKVKM